MRAVLPFDPASPSAAPRLGDLPVPAPAAGEVLVAVAAAGLNHADLLQLAGRYPPPAGESPVPGLELAGIVEAVGEGVSGWKAGDRAMALVAGGAHAERAAVPAGQLLALPVGWTFVEGAAVPEAALTAWVNLIAEGGLAAGEAVAVTGATGGMGSFAVQLARELGSHPVLAVGRDRSRLAALERFGGTAVLSGPGLAGRLREATGGRGVDLAVDFVGGADTGELIRALAPGGRLVLAGLLAGSRAEVDLGAVLRGRLRLAGSLLRSRPREEKAALVAAFAAFAGPRLADRRLAPVVDRAIPLARAAEAYAALAAGGGRGKIVLTME